MRMWGYSLCLRGPGTWWPAHLCRLCSLPTDPPPCSVHSVASCSPPGRRPSSARGPCRPPWRGRSPPVSFLWGFHEAALVLLWWCPLHLSGQGVLHRSKELCLLISGDSNNKKSTKYLNYWYILYKTVNNFSNCYFLGRNLVLARTVCHISVEGNYVLYTNCHINPCNY